MQHDLRIWSGKIPMCNKLIASLAAGSMLLGSTAALAGTRPHTTRFTQPASNSENAVSGLGLGAILLLGGLSLAAALAITASGGNSPR